MEQANGATVCPSRQGYPLAQMPPKNYVQTPNLDKQLGFRGIFL